MRGWQKPVRLAVGVFGIACAVVVYLAMGERSRSAPQPAVERIDPAAIAETTHGVLLQVKGAQEDFEVRYDTSVAYRDGSTRLTGVRITTTHHDGRRFVVTAQKATAQGDGRHVELFDDVHLRASDGFELWTGNGSYSQDDSVLRAPNRATFGKERMSGAGRGMSYDRNADVLRIDAEAEVLMEGTGESADTHVAADSAVLDRGRNVLELDRNVRVTGGRSMSADRALARLSADGDRITFVELRGNARVGQVASVEAMQAEEIDLDYEDEGSAIERATLRGNAQVSMIEGGVARDFAGQRFDVAFGPDGTIAHVEGDGGVRMVLPAAGDVPARRVESSRLRASGTGGVLSDIRFEEHVVFQEETGDGMRVARAETLGLALAGDGALREAAFTGAVTFEDAVFAARAAEAGYEPAGGILVLSGLGPQGEPSVEDGRVVVSATGIRIGVQTQHIDAEGAVKTALRAAGEASGAGKVSRTPGFLAADQATRITARTLAYDGIAGHARYAGRVRLWQKETDVRADTMDINLGSGDLIARGNAQAVLALGMDRSEGEAHEIAYDDEARRISYRAAADPGTSPARLVGPQGDLQARNIDVFLAGAESRMDRLEADGAVEALVDGRRVTGAQLVYRAAGEEYVVTGSATAPVLVRTETPCREIRGRTLIYSKATDTMHVDGSEVSRTQTTRGGSCR